MNIMNSSTIALASGFDLALIALIAGSIALVLAIIELVGMWCLLQKMGRHDYASLIPGYNLWEYARGAGLNAGLATLFILSLIGIAVCMSGYTYTFMEPFFTDSSLMNTLLMSVNKNPYATTAILGGAWIDEVTLGLQGGNPWIIGAAVSFVVYVILYLVTTVGVSKSFGHGFFYFLGLIIVPFICIPVLGLSKKQRYRGPYFNKELRNGDPTYWANAVAARQETLGSNAPLALSLIGLIMSCCLMPIGGIVLFIIATMRNAKEKAKPLANAKTSATVVICITGIIISIVIAYVLFRSYAYIIQSLGMYLPI